MVRKLTHFERHVIDEALKLYKIKVDCEIAHAKVKGKNHIFGKNFIPMTINDITVKLNYHTTKKKK